MTDTEMNSDEELAEALSLPMTIGVDAYISEDYARAELAVDPGRTRPWAARKKFAAASGTQCVLVGVS